MPATAASAAPMTKVMEMVRSTSTPSSAAMVWSCSQARMSRPSRVRDTSQVKIASSTMVLTTTMICTLDSRTTKPSLPSMQGVAAGDDRRHRLDPRALRDLRVIGQHERHADRRQHRGEAERMPQRPVGDALHRPAIERGNRHRHQKHDQQDHRYRGQPHRDQDQERDQRNEATDHEDVAMGEIDHADDAIDHGVADGDQAVDRAEHDAVDQLLGEIVHALPLVGAFSGKMEHDLPLTENARFNNYAAMAPGSRNVASCHFLTAGTRGGNSAEGADLRACTELVFKRRFHGRGRDKRNRTGTGKVPCNQCQRSRLFPRDIQQGRSRCPIRTRIRASRTRIRGRSPVSSRVVARSPDSSSRIRTVRARNPTSRVRAVASSDPNYAGRSRRKAGLFFLGRGDVVSPVN